jgi:excisionase family DNA binding protein
MKKAHSQVEEETRMTQTRTKPQRTKPTAVTATPVGFPQGPTPEVFTLAEAAAYLRVPEGEVVRLVQQQDLPGRLLGTEWRFLKSALQDWLRMPPPRGSKEAVLSVAGAWKDDPYVEEELQEIYKHRGRPMTEEGK